MIRQKENDVIWLYGPLRPANTIQTTTQHECNINSNVSRYMPFTHPKPILKGSMSQVILQPSFPASSSLKPAATSLRTRGSGSALMKNVHESKCSDISPPLHSRKPKVDYFGSKSTSRSDMTEFRKKRRVRFDEKVEQCIALECKHRDDHEDIENKAGVSSDGEDEGISSLKPTKRSRLRRNASSSRSFFSSHNAYMGLKTIKVLPSTILKYKGDITDINNEQQQKSVRLTQSWSAGTLSPIRPGRNFLHRQDDEEENDTGANSGCYFGTSNAICVLGDAGPPSDELPHVIAVNKHNSRNYSIFNTFRQTSANGGYATSCDTYTGDVAARRVYKLPTSASENGEACEMEGMRRTRRGKFMPYEEDEDDVIVKSLYGRVFGTVNMVRDIAHVIWNVGRRK